MELNAIRANYFFYYSKMGKGFDSVLETISKLLQTIKENLSNDNEESRRLLFFIFKVINKLTNYSKHTHIDKIDTCYLQTSNRFAEVSLKRTVDGLQIMGV
jgi:hypothetical protein